MLRVLYLIFCLLGVFTVYDCGYGGRDTPPTVLVWGDSLSAAYGIPVEKGWVSLLQAKLGDKYTVVNGSISGETSAGGLTRLPDALQGT